MCAQAQTAPLAGHEVAWNVDSGFVSAPSGASPQAVYATTVAAPRAPWIRVSFDQVLLPGRVEEGRGAYLKITSLRDGAVQYLNSITLAQWANTTAYFNGDAVTIVLFAFPGVGSSRVSIRSVTAGEVGAGGGTDTICGPADDRTLFGDRRLARHLPEGCTTWLFSDTNHAFLTAGHCAVSPGDVQEFNCPLSDASGNIAHPAPQDQYVVDPASIQWHFNSAVLYGEDFTYFACFPNSNTGLTPYQAQGQYFELATFVPFPAGQTLRVTGYGTTSNSQSPLEWNQVEKTDFGPFMELSATTIKYQVDTTGGNSGSPVEDLTTGRVIGIHANAGCSNPLGATSNAGTALNYPVLQAALASPLSLCLTGKGAPVPPLCAIGDGANNFGTLSTQTGNFGKVADVPPRMEGLAYNWHTGLFYAVSNDISPANPGRYLYTIAPTTGATTVLAQISGSPYPINGLGYDPYSQILYGVSQFTGGLVVIDTASGVASPIGPSNAGTSIGALEYSPRDFMLYGIDNGNGTSLLVKWPDPTQPPIPVGYLGAGISNCNGLAVTDSGDLWTISASSNLLLRVDPFSGAATAIGPTNGVFGASYGMSAVLSSHCYANCDSSTAFPVLNANDFQCFLNAYAVGDPYANCDGSVVAR